jgi:hypothetical protein
MISLERCRQILGRDCAMSEVELMELRDDLYALADIAVTSFRCRSAGMSLEAGKSSASKETQPKEASS